MRPNCIVWRWSLRNSKRLYNTLIPGTSAQAPFIILAVRERIEKQRNTKISVTTTGSQAEIRSDYHLTLGQQTHRAYRVNYLRVCEVAQEMDERSSCGCSGGRGVPYHHPDPQSAGSVLVNKHWSMGASSLHVDNWPACDQLILRKRLIRAIAGLETWATLPTCSRTYQNNFLNSSRKSPRYMEQRRLIAVFRSSHTEPYPEPF
jgi:hypothetical protein